MDKPLGLAQSRSFHFSFIAVFRLNNLFLQNQLTNLENKLQQVNLASHN